MARWCPSCGAEYVEGWGTCSTCGEELVAEPPKRAEPEQPFRREDAIFTEPRAVREYSDPFTPIWEGDTVEATRLARHLEAANIPVDLGEAPEPGQARVEVPRSYIEEAFIVFDTIGSAPAPRPEPDDDDPDDLPAEGGWSPAMRAALWVVAIAVIVGLIVTSRF